ncbi:probable zinc finger CCCH domain-containing protein 2 at N-terminal half [Coccomyxa sp. Obi]|nr:probable zinc finger CCCH domain-containing protein 2 at N-terminal half [Coccomyxa sp. Obi]
MCRISVPTPHKAEIRRDGRLQHHPKKGAGQHKTTSPAGNRHEFISDHFMMYGLKVIPCSTRFCHEWSECPYAHEGEKAARRDPATFLYTGVICPDMKKSKVCPRGDDCPFAHTVFEYWLHPTRFRTVFCADGDNCTRKFCFFAHSPEELREPELAQLQSPSERRTPEGTPQHVSSNIKVAAGTANIDQAPAALIESLVEILRAEPDEIKKKLEDAQEDSLPAHDLPLPTISEKPGSEPLQGGMRARDACTCGCGGKSGKRQRELADVSSESPLTKLELAAYLAGYQYALGLRDGGAIQPVPAPQPQPIPQQPLFSSGAFAQRGMDACSQSSFQEPCKMGVPGVGDIDACCTLLPALLDSFDFSSLPHQPPLPDTLAPIAYDSTPTEPPNSPFSNTWDETIYLGASAVDPLSAAPCLLKVDWDNAAQPFQQAASSLDWGPPSSLSDLSPSSMDSTSCGPLDPVVNFHGSSLSSHAAPFDHLTAKHNSPSGRTFPEFSLF